VGLLVNLPANFSTLRCFFDFFMALSINFKKIKEIENIDSAVLGWIYWIKKMESLVWMYVVFVLKLHEMYSRYKTLALKCICFI